MTILTGPIPSVPRSLKQRLAIFAGLLLICDFSTGILVDWANTPFCETRADAKALRSSSCDRFGKTTLVLEQAENNLDAVAQDIEQQVCPGSTEPAHRLCFHSHDTACILAANLEDIAYTRMIRVQNRLAKIMQHPWHTNCQLYDGVVPKCPLSLILWILG